MLVPLLAWVAVASLAALAATGWDKAAARGGRRRVPERVLLSLALVGGSPGLGLAMLAFRHKTRKAPFVLAYLAVLALQGVAAWVLLQGPAQSRP